MKEDNWVLALANRLTITSIVLSVIIFLWRYRSLPPLVPLWYGKPWGTDRLAHPLWLIVLPAASLVILIINTIATRTVTRDMLIFRQILATTALLVAILSLVTLSKIVFLVS